MTTIPVQATTKEFTRFAQQWPQFVSAVKQNIMIALKLRIPGLVQSMLGTYPSKRNWSTGEMSSSMGFELHPRGIKMTFGVEHAKYVLQGVGQHVIEPKNKERLSWVRLGQRVFRNKVVHPGQTARTDIIQAIKDVAVQVVEEEVAQALKDIEHMGGAS